jgi:hypothetical protein
MGERLFCNDEAAEMPYRATTTVPKYARNAAVFL